MDSGASDTKRELIDRLRDLEIRQLKLFLRDRSLPLLSTTLTIQQLKVLVALAIDGNTPTHELAERVGVSVATLTGIVDRWRRALWCSAARIPRTGGCAGWISPRRAEPS